MAAKGWVGPGTPSYSGGGSTAPIVPFNSNPGVYIPTPPSEEKKKSTAKPKTPAPKPKPKTPAAPKAPAAPAAPSAGSGAPITSPSGGPMTGQVSMAGDESGGSVGPVTSNAMLQSMNRFRQGIGQRTPPMDSYSLASLRKIY